jgi:hypothetical protein
MRFALPPKDFNNTALKAVAIIAKRRHEEVGSIVFVDHNGSVMREISLAKFRKAVGMMTVPCSQVLKRRLL